MRASLQALIRCGLVPLAITVALSRASAAGPVVPAKIAGAADAAVAQVHYRRHRGYACCAQRYYRPQVYAHRRPVAPYRAYYAAGYAPYAPRAYYGAPAYYPPAVVYYAPPIVYYPAPVIYRAAPYGGHMNAGYGSYGW